MMTKRLFNPDVQSFNLMDPYFYISSFAKDLEEIELDEDNSKHIIQVLRMRQGEMIRLTDGKGNLITASILDEHKKKCRVRRLSVTFIPPPEKKVSVAISPLKNTARFEWFLEKATEIGVSEIIPLICEHTERSHLRPDRLQNILVSALLQSQQTWLPVLQAPASFPLWVPAAKGDRLFIAHCLPEPRPPVTLASQLLLLSVGAAPSQGPSTPSFLILIGPEGDFSPKEVELALSKEFIPVSLGETRLRTETAGIVAATLLCMG